MQGVVPSKKMLHNAKTCLLLYELCAKTQDPKVCDAGCVVELLAPRVGSERRTGPSRCDRILTQLVCTRLQTSCKKAESRCGILDKLAKHLKASAAADLKETAAPVVAEPTNAPAAAPTVCVEPRQRVLPAGYSSAVMLVTGDSVSCTEVCAMQARLQIAEKLGLAANTLSVVKSQSKCTSTGFLLHAVFFTDAHLRRAHKLKQVWQLGAFPSIVDHTITAVGIHAGLAPTKMPSVATYAPDAPGAAQKGHKDIRTIFAKTSAPTATSRPSTKWEEHFWGDTQTPVPTTVPSVMPTFAPTSDPSDTPSVLPSSAPSLAPTTTEGPSLAPSTSAPTYVPVPCPMSAE